MPAFWGYPAHHDYPYYWFILDPKSVTNLKNLPQLQIFEFWEKSLHATRLLKLLDKMRKCEMDPVSIVKMQADTILSTDR